MSLPPQPQIDDNKIPLSSPELVGSIFQQPPPERVTISPPSPPRQFVTQPPIDRRVITLPPSSSPPRQFETHSYVDRRVVTLPPPPDRLVATRPPSDRRVMSTDLTTRTTETARESFEREEWLRVFNIPKENPEVSVILMLLVLYI